MDDTSPADDLDSLPMAIWVGPPDVPPPSRAVRLLKSWKLWLLGLFMALVAIGVSLGIRGYQRYQALKYLDEQPCRYELSADSEWITERFGDRAKGFRSVDTIRIAMISDESCSRISEFPEVRKLRISSHGFVTDNQVSNRGIDSLRNLSQLQVLYLSYGDFTDPQLAELLSSDLPVVTVTLNTGQPSRQTLEALSRISTLTSLQLRASWGPLDEDFRGLAPFQNLQHLVLSGAGPECLLWIEDLSRLETLELPPSAITWETLEALRRVPSLKRIGILVGPPGSDVLDTDLQAAIDQKWEVVQVHLDPLSIDRGVDQIPQFGGGGGTWSGGGTGFF